MYPADLRDLVASHHQYSGLFLQRIRQLSLVDYVLEFTKNRNILISLNSNTPFIVFNANLEEFPPGGELHSFAIDLRRFLNGRLLSISQPGDDMVLALSFEERNNVLDQEIFTLYVELVPNHPQAVLVNSDNKILAAFRYNNERGKDGRLIRRNNYYSRITPLPLKTAKKTNDFPYLEAYLLQYGERIKRQNYRPLYVHLEHTIKRLERLIRNYKGDLKKLENIPLLYEHANLLLTNKPQIEGETVQIEGQLVKVDPRYNAFVNAEMLFNRAKKLKRSEAILNNRIAEANNEIKYLSAIYGMLQTFKTHEDYMQVYEELNLVKPNVRTHIKSSLLPYFVMYKDIRILFGRNNKQNDYLSFKIAKKTHTFVHIRNVPGAHIIIEHPNPPKDVLEHASKLALYLSKKIDGDITYTNVANIKKGPFPGQVLLKREQTLFVRLKDDEALYFKNAIKRLI